MPGHATDVPSAGRVPWRGQCVCVGGGEGRSQALVRASVPGLRHCIWDDRYRVQQAHRTAGPELFNLFFYLKTIVDIQYYTRVRFRSQ